MSYEEWPRIRGQFVRIEKLMAQNIMRDCFQMFLASPWDRGGDAGAVSHYWDARPGCERACRTNARRVDRKSVV